MIFIFNRTWFFIDRSPWPFRTSILLFIFVFHFLYIITLFNFCSLLIKSFWIFVFFCFLAQMMFWGFSLSLEAAYYFKQFFFVWINLKAGMKFFIISEVFFFFGFFWSFFWYGVEPHVFILNVWPPIYSIDLDSWNLPWLNTIILVISGISITYSHNALKILNNFVKVREGLFFTLVLSLLFLFNQFFEYLFLGLQINDGVFGSIFYLATGFHCFHVLIGSILLSLNFFRFYFFLFSLRSFGLIFFEASIWYWHFVDLVWIFLFATIYLCTSNFL